MAIQHNQNRSYARKSSIAGLVVVPLLLLGSTTLNAQPLAAQAPHSLRAEHQELTWWAQFTQWLVSQRTETGNARTQDKDDRSSEDQCTGSCG